MHLAVFAAVAIAAILLIGIWANGGRRKPMTKKELIEALSSPEIPDDAQIDAEVTCGDYERWPDIVAVDGYDSRFGYVTLRTGG